MLHRSTSLPKVQNRVSTFGENVDDACAFA
jgi:hypothetical protein